MHTSSCPPSTREHSVFISLPDVAEWPLRPHMRGSVLRADLCARLTPESQLDSTTIVKRVLFNEDLLQLCLSALNFRDVSCAAATCMTWSRVATRESLWRFLYVRDYALTRGVALEEAEAKAAASLSQLAAAEEALDAAQKKEPEAAFDKERAAMASVLAAAEAKAQALVPTASGWRAAYQHFLFAQLIKVPQLAFYSSTLDQDYDDLCKVVLLGPSFCASTFLQSTCHRHREFGGVSSLVDLPQFECGVCYARYLGKVHKVLICDLPANERDAYDGLIRAAHCVCVCFNVHEATTFERLIDPCYCSWEHHGTSTYRSLVLVGLDSHGCSSNKDRRREREVSYERASAFAASMSDGDTRIPYVECDLSSGNGIGLALGAMLSRRGGLPLGTEWRRLNNLMINLMMSSRDTATLNSRDTATLWQSIPSTSTVASVGLNVVGGLTSLLPLPSTSTVASVGLNVVEGLTSLLPSDSLMDSLLPLSWRE